MDYPTKNGDFQQQTVSLPEGKWGYDPGGTLFLGYELLLSQLPVQWFDGFQHLLDLSRFGHLSQRSPVGVHLSVLFRVEDHVSDMIMIL